MEKGLNGGDALNLDQDILVETSDLDAGAGRECTAHVLFWVVESVSILASLMVWSADPHGGQTFVARFLPCSRISLPL